MLFRSMIRGLELVGKKMAWYVKTANKLAKSKKVAVMCARGGKRSGSLGWLLNLVGFDVQILNGGYKAYRNEMQVFFEEHALKIIIIGGKTGTGKTEILQQLKKKGAQILDLEGLANHKGSAFGALGELPQPRSEHYENILYHEIKQLDYSKTVYVENESRLVGHCTIPQGLWDQMQNATVYNVEIPHADRVQRLIVDYAQFSVEELIAAFKRIEKKLGNLNLQKAEKALLKGDFATATEIALFFYDKTYSFGLENKRKDKPIDFKFDHSDMEKIAESILNYKKL